MREALVDHDLAREWITRGVKHFGDDAALHVAALAAGHAEQVRFLGLEQPRFLRGRGLLQHLRLQLLVFAQQPLLAREILGHAAHGFAGHRRDLLQRVGQHGERQAHGLERVEAVVGDHERDRREGEEGEARERAGTAVEEGGRLADHQGDGPRLLDAMA